MRPYVSAFIRQDSGCGDLDRVRAKALRQCAGGCGALVAPPRHFCAPCSDEHREKRAREARRRRKERAARNG